MIKVKVRPINYYNAISWCMTNIKGKYWTTDPNNHTLSFRDSKDALIVSMRWS